MRWSHGLPVEEKVDGDGEAEDDDNGPQDAIADAAGIARAGIAAGGAGDHHEPAETPLDGSSDDEGDDRDAVGHGGDDNFEGVDFRDAFDATEGEGGHGEQAGAGSEIADVVGDGEQGSEQRHHGHGMAMLGVNLVILHAAADHAGNGTAESKSD